MLSADESRLCSSVEPQVASGGGIADKDECCWDFIASSALFNTPYRSSSLFILLSVLFLLQ